MFRLRTLLIVPLVILAFSGSAIAAPILLVAFLSGSQENPPVNTPAFGFATFELNDAQTAMTFSATITGIDFTTSQTPGSNLDNLAVAHIHRAPVGVNGPVVWGFIGSPFNETAPNDMVLTPFASGVGGVVTGKWDVPEGNGLFEGNPVTLTNQLPFILNSGTYINFHTVQFGGGEIRGQLQVTDSLTVPEPATLALFGIGVACLGFRRKSTP